MFSPKKRKYDNNGTEISQVFQIQSAAYDLLFDEVLFLEQSIELNEDFDLQFTSSKQNLNITNGFLDPNDPRVIQSKENIVHEITKRVSPGGAGGAFAYVVYFYESSQYDVKKQKLKNYNWKVLTFDPIASVEPESPKHEEYFVSYKEYVERIRQKVFSIGIGSKIKRFNRPKVFIIRFFRSKPFDKENPRDTTITQFTKKAA